VGPRHPTWDFDGSAGKEIPCGIPIVRQMRQPNCAIVSHCHILFLSLSVSRDLQHSKNHQKLAFSGVFHRFSIFLQPMEIGIPFAGVKKQQRQFNGNRLWQKFLESISARPTPAWP
jgi:hypothetical protein